ncbi:MAG: hypothetical protein LBT92_02830 [Rickettsiales bacterium]|jgi:hypothetical protein|nr:hypothetical protein [Rickettsiales bacterium]
MSNVYLKVNNGYLKCKAAQGQRIAVFLYSAQPVDSVQRVGLAWLSSPDAKTHDGAVAVREHLSESGTKVAKDPHYYGKYFFDKDGKIIFRLSRVSPMTDHDALAMFQAAKREAGEGLDQASNESARQ